MASIIYIEDEPDLREDVAEELTDAGYTVYVAADGAEGLEIILDKKPDLILSDITMPRMDGHALLRELRSKHADLPPTPFIFVSALADHKEMKQGLEMGADDYMTKPINYDLLLVVVQTALQRGERMRREAEGAFTPAQTDPVLDKDIGWR